MGKRAGGGGKDECVMLRETILKVLLLPDLNTILFSSVVMDWLLVLEVTGSNLARTLHLCHAFVRLFLYY